jgi:hypothetical protein
MTELDRSVKVRPRFLRSARLDVVDSDELLDGFVLHETGEKILTRVIEEIQTGPQRAFTWTGAYGSGKSTLALYLTKLLSTSPERRKGLKPRTKGGASAFKHLLSKISGKEKPWHVITIVGQKNNVEATLRHEFSRVIDADADPDPDKPIASVISDALNFASENYSGLLVVIDEMGRHLEHAAEENKSIDVLQEIAEIFARSEFPAGFIGLLHQAFHDYLPRTDRVQRQEWETVQGRFSDLLFGLSIEESILLISSAIKGRPPSDVDKELISICCGSLGSGRLSLNKSLPRHLEGALPLHPYTAVLLCLISRQRFGQNERSLFSFLASNEPAGLQEFSRNEDDGLPNHYTIDLLFDYLQINLGRSIAAVEGLGQRWSDAEECVIRAEHIDHVTTAVVKVISVAEVFGRSINLVATKQFLLTALPHYGEQEIIAALSKAQEKSIIEFRHFKGGYALTLGSDLDLDAELAKLRANMTIDDINIDFGSFADLKPIVAKQHYHKKGTQRYFDTRITSVNRLNDEKLVALDPFFDGAFLLFLDEVLDTGADPISTDKAKKLVGWESEKRPVLVSIMDEPRRLYEQALEVSAINRLSKELVELQSDKIARRRLSSMAQDAESELIKRIMTVLNQQDWTMETCQRIGTQNLSAAASVAADMAYEKCPPIFNELVNRHKPSAAATKARRVLMNRMESDGDQPNLGIEKSPPELGIFLSVLQRNNLYPNPTPGTRHGQTRHSGFEAMFQAADEILKASNGNEVVRAEAIFSVWGMPPFGVRIGVAPLLLMSYLLEKRAHIAPYVDGRFVVEFGDLFVERLSRAPKTISLRWASMDGAKKGLVDALAKFINEKLAGQASGTPLDVARQLVHFAFKLPNFSKSYRGGNYLIQLSEETLAFRAELLLADDPLKLLFEKLPKAFEIDLKDRDAISRYVEKTDLAVQELKAVFPALIADLRRHIENEFPAGDADNRIGAIRELAKGLQSKTFDPSYDRFISALASDDDDDQWAENIAGRAIHKPVNRWLDSDITEAKVQLVNLANRFRAIIELEQDVGGNVVSVGMRMGNGTVRTGHRLILADESAPSIKKASDRIREVVEIQGLTSDEKIAALTRALQDLIDEQTLPSGKSKNIP